MSAIELESASLATRAARLLALADAVVCGERPLAAVRAMIHEARAAGDLRVEAAACTVAMVCIHDARETYAGLAELQQRVLALNADCWLDQQVATLPHEEEQCLLWTRLGRLIAGLFTAAVAFDPDRAAEETMQALAAAGRVSLALRLTCARYLLGVAEMSASQSWLGRIDALAESAVEQAAAADCFARDEWLAERATVAGFMFIRRRIDESTLAAHVKRGANVGTRQRFKIARAELMRVALAQDLDRELLALEALRAALPPHEVVPWIAYLRLRAEYLLRRREFVEAEALGIEALVLSERISAHAPMLVACHVVLATARGLQGRFDEAAADFDRASAIALPGHAVLMAGVATCCAVSPRLIVIARRRAPSLRRGSPRRVGRQHSMCSSMRRMCWRRSAPRRWTWRSSPNMCAP